MRGLTYCGEDSPVLGGEVAEGFGVELHYGQFIVKRSWDVKYGAVVVVWK